MPYSADLRALFEHSLDGILLTTPDGHIVAANPAACCMLGRSEAELRALGRDGVLDASDPRVVDGVRERARTGRFFGEITMTRRDGTRFPAELSSAIYDGGDGRPRACVIVRDVSERRRAEAEQRAALENLRSMIQRAPLAVQGIDPDGTVTVWNAAAERLFGWSAAEVLGRANPLVDPGCEAEHLALRARVLAGETLSGVELRRARKDGSSIDVSLSTSCVRAFDGRVVTILALFEDIAPRKAAERALVRERQLEALRGLALGVRHEMNNALGALRLELEFVATQPEMPAAEREDALASALALCARLAATLHRVGQVEELGAVPYLGDTMMLDVSPTPPE